MLGFLSRPEHSDHGQEIAAMKQEHGAPLPDCSLLLAGRLEGEAWIEEANRMLGNAFDQELERRGEVTTDDRVVLDDDAMSRV
ncbi:MAG TPA: hypothetical protein VIG29_21035 [Vicinamibacteria bacterium]|jgi:hypothetical protein